MAEQKQKQEQERLRRQIRLLQGLINDHKNVHGNAPPPPPPSPLPLASQWRNPTPPAFSSQGMFLARYSQQTQKDFQPRQSSTWRKKYSLVNVPRRPMLCPGNTISASSSQAAQSHRNTEIPKPRIELSEKSAAFGGERSVAGMRSSSTVNNSIVPGSQRALSGATEGPRSLAWPTGSSSTESKEISFTTSLPLRRPQTIARSRTDIPATSQKQLETASVVHCASEVAGGPRKTISESAVTLKSEPLSTFCFESSCLLAKKKPASQVSVPQTSHQTPAAVDKLNIASIAGASGSHVSLEASSAVGKRLSKTKHSGPALQRTPSLPTAIRSPKFKKASYTWVANSGKCPRAAKRWTTSRSSENSRKFTVGVDRNTKLLPRGDLGGKHKKSSMHSKLGISSSKYKWKAPASSQPPPPPPPPPPPSWFAFTWQRKECFGAKAPHYSGASTFFQPESHMPLVNSNSKASFGNTGLFSYKLKSRTKIIKRKGLACSTTDKKSGSFPTVLLKSRFCLRKRNSPRGRCSPTAKKVGTKGLVQIGKHRLRRLPASRVYGSGKEGSSFHFSTSPTANKVVNTRYRLVKKAVASPSGSMAPVFSPAHTWKARRHSASRSLVLNRTRHSPPTGGKCQALQQQWKSKGLRCIGGVMYRVSANKLAKTSSSPLRGSEAGRRSPARTGRSDPAHSGFAYSPAGCPNRSATRRYIASRAIQRSLAIIRQAKQKKEHKKEYCMYYNRFGKCNRGESCPYIHDPEKVAVCTRFLRGTCKKTDGTCPFSHKVSKEKMPVCSYFLKGICNNCDCPYSHVYVSRKAEVCSDFLKGYCPLGEKCKKKHTLVCPDFSKSGVCPKGAQCKLQHPQRKHHVKQPSSTDALHRECPAPKWGRGGGRTLKEEEEEEEEEERPGPSGSAPGPSLWSHKVSSQTSMLTKLPSFISLRSPSTSPGEEEPKSARDRSEEEAGKPLQIKPRL